MFEEKNIHDIFKDTNLENEDWLEPSDRVLQNIEAEIYKKKRNRWFWFLPLALLGLLGVFMLAYYTNPYLNDKLETKVNESSINSITPNEPKIKRITESIPSSNPEIQKLLSHKQELDNKELPGKTSEAESAPLVAKVQQLPKGNKDSDKENLNNLSNKRNSTNSRRNRKFNDEIVTALNVKNEVQPQKIEKRNSKKESENKPIALVEPVSTIVKNISTQSVIKPNKNRLEKQTPTSINNANESILQKGITRLILPANTKSAVEKNNGLNKKRIRTIKRLIPKQGLLFDNILNNFAGLKNNILPNETQSLQYTFSSGLSLWKFILNETYAKKLKNASFKYNTGKGFFISTGVQKALNPKIKIEGNLLYEQVIFKSAHNAALEYTSPGSINNFDVDIASPIGFSNSNIGIKKTAGNLDESIDLKVDLNNSHQIFNLDAQANLSAQFINFPKLSGATVFTAGITQVLYIKNKLLSLETNNTEFEFSGNTELSRQTGLNKTRPYFGIGFHLNYKVKSNQALSFRYQFKQDVVPFYKIDSFKSTLNRQQLGLSFLIKF